MITWFTLEGADHWETQLKTWEISQAVGWAMHQSNSRVDFLRKPFPKGIKGRWAIRWLSLGTGPTVQSGQVVTLKATTETDSSFHLSVSRIYFSLPFLTATILLKGRGLLHFRTGWNFSVTEFLPFPLGKQEPSVVRWTVGPPKIRPCLLMWPYWEKTPRSYNEGSWDDIIMNYPGKP